jgi:hypothetical protein
MTFGCMHISSVTPASLTYLTRMYCVQNVRRFGACRAASSSAQFWSILPPPNDIPPATADAPTLVPLKQVALEKAGGAYAEAAAAGTFVLLVLV